MMETVVPCSLYALGKWGFIYFFQLAIDCSKRVQHCWRRSSSFYSGGQPVHFPISILSLHLFSMPVCYSPGRLQFLLLRLSLCKFLPFPASTHCPSAFF